ncbi:hypothetical protein ACVMFA_007279 [Bradyrhizobium liaoningense]
MFSALSNVDHWLCLLLAVRVTAAPSPLASYRQILVTAGPVRRRRFWAHGQPCLAMTSIPSLNVTPSTSFGNWL